MAEHNERPVHPRVVRVAPTRAEFSQLVEDFQEAAQTLAAVVERFDQLEADLSTALSIRDHVLADLLYAVYGDSESVEAAESAESDETEDQDEDPESESEDAVQDALERGDFAEEWVEFGH